MQRRLNNTEKVKETGPASDKKFKLQGRVVVQSPINKEWDLHDNI